MYYEGKLAFYQYHRDYNLSSLDFKEHTFLVCIRAKEVLLSLPLLMLAYYMGIQQASLGTRDLILSGK